MSAHPATYLVPQFLLDQRAIDPIIDIVVDSSRQLLYTLSRLQVITVYDLGDDGESFALIGKSLSALAEAARKFANSNARTRLADQPQDVDCKKFKNLRDWVVSIHVIPVVESSDVHLVAVTRNCMRVYLTTKKKPRNSGGRSSSSSSSSTSGISPPDQLRIVSIRLPPPTKFPEEQQRSNRNSYDEQDQRVGLPGE